MEVIFKYETITYIQIWVHIDQDIVIETYDKKNSCYTNQLITEIFNYKNDIGFIHSIVDNPTKFKEYRNRVKSINIYNVKPLFDIDFEASETTFNTGLSQLNKKYKDNQLLNMYRRHLNLIEINNING